MSAIDDAITALEALSAELPAAPGEVLWVPSSGPCADLTGPELVIRNPAARGALTAAMMVQLARAVVDASDATFPVLLLRGEAGAFCSGGHLGQVRGGLGRPDRGARMARAMSVVLDSLLLGPRVVVGRVAGPALGGGAELLTACDHVLCGPGARIGFVQAALGVAPGWGGAARLVRRVGPTRALRMLTSAEVMDGERAVHEGLADRFGPSLDDVQEAFLAPLRSVSTDALRAVKQQVVAASPLTRSGAEADRFAEVWGSPEHLRRLGAGRA